MLDTTAHHVAPLTLSEHSRLLLATHRAMRADGQRLVTATQTSRTEHRATQPRSAEPSARA
jgi:hypothetical protein